MAGKLRDDLRKYETESNTRFSCKFSRIKCLSCPISAVGCPLARRQLTERVAKG